MNKPPIDKCPVCQNVLRSDPFFAGMDYWCDHPKSYGESPHYVCTFLDMGLNGKPSPLTVSFKINNYYIRMQMVDMVIIVGRGTHNPIVMPALDINWNDLNAFTERLKNLLVFL